MFRYAERMLQKVGAATKRAGGEEATVGANVQRRCVCDLSILVMYCLCATFLVSNLCTIIFLFISQFFTNGLV